MSGSPASGRLDAVLLDALGTLLKLEPPAPRLVTQLRERLELEVTLRQAEQAVAAEIAYYREHLNEGRDPESLAGLRARCARVLGDHLPAVDAPLPGLTDALLASLEFTLYDDVVPGLARLRDRGLRLVVVSNWDVSLGEVLTRVGLAGRIDAVVTSAEVGHRKPAPEIFAAGLRAAGTPAARTLHVGDSPAEDIAGALAAGISPVLLVRGGAPRACAEHLPDGVRTISSLVELEDV